jgi:hypothetical protein
VHRRELPGRVGQLGLDRAVGVGRNDTAAEADEGRLPRRVQRDDILPPFGNRPFSSQTASLVTSVRKRNKTCGGGLFMLWLSVRPANPGYDWSGG